MGTGQEWLLGLDSWLITFGGGIENIVRILAAVSQLALIHQTDSNF